jgi:hypothetical protein
MKIVLLVIGEKNKISMEFCVSHQRSNLQMKKQVFNEESYEETPHSPGYSHCEN